MVKFCNLSPGRSRFGRGAIGRSVNADGAAPAVLCNVAGDIGLRHHLRHSGVGRINLGDADTGADAVLLSAVAEGKRRNRLNDTPAEHPGAGEGAIRQQQAKLIAAEAGKHISRTQHLLHQRRQRLQQGIAGGMPGGVIDRLEAVEIDKGQRVRLVAMR